MINRRLKIALPAVPGSSHAETLAEQGNDFCCLLLETANMRVDKIRRLVPC
jgi:hypothetical protein